MDPTALTRDALTLHTAPLTVGGITVLQMLAILRAMKWQVRDFRRWPRPAVRVVSNRIDDAFGLQPPPLRQGHPLLAGSSRSPFFSPCLTPHFFP